MTKNGLTARLGQPVHASAEADDQQDTEEVAAAAAEDEEQSAAAEDEEDEAGGEAEPDPDQDDEEETAASARAHAEGAAAERVRWSTVLSHDAAAGRTQAARDLLADSDMSAENVVNLLGKLPKDAAADGGGFAGRMRQQPAADIGDGGGADMSSPGARLAARMDRHNPKPLGDRPASRQ